MDNRWKPLIWSVAALLLLFSILTPLSIFSIFALMVPFVVLFTMLNPAAFLGHAVAIGVAAYLLGEMYLQHQLLLPLLIFFMIPAVVMGYLYKKKMQASKVLLAGFVTLLGQLLLVFVLQSLLFKIDFSASLANFMQEPLQQIETLYQLEAGWAEQMAKDFVDAVMMGFPTLLLLGSLSCAAVTHALSRRALLRSGIEVPGLPQVKTWMLPRSLVWYYLIAWIIYLAVPAEGNDIWVMLGANLTNILQLAFTIQGVAFFFFLADVKRWSNAVRVLVVLLAVLFHAILPIYLIGLLDVAFPLRRHFSK